MTIEKIYNHINDNGGITYNIRSGELVGSGYAVSIHKELETKILLSDWNNDGKLMIETFIVKNNEHWKDETKMFGAWISDGYVWLDVTTVINDKEGALRVARDNKQLAIFNLETFEEIKA